MKSAISRGATGDRVLLRLWLEDTVVSGKVDSLHMDGVITRHTS